MHSRAWCRAQPYKARLGLWWRRSPTPIQVPHAGGSVICMSRLTYIWYLGLKVQQQQKQYIVTLLGRNKISWWCRDSSQSALRSTYAEILRYRTFTNLFLNHDAWTGHNCCFCVVPTTVIMTMWPFDIFTTHAHAHSLEYVFLENYTIGTPTDCYFVPLPSVSQYCKYSTSYNNWYFKERAHEKFLLSQLRCTNLWSKRGFGVGTIPAVVSSLIFPLTWTPLLLL